MFGVLFCLSIFFLVFNSLYFYKYSLLFSFLLFLFGEGTGTYDPLSQFSQPPGSSDRCPPRPPADPDHQPTTTDRSHATGLPQTSAFPNKTSKNKQQHKHKLTHRKQTNLRSNQFRRTHAPQKAGAPFREGRSRAALRARRAEPGGAWAQRGT